MCCLRGRRQEACFPLRTAREARLALGWGAQSQDPRHPPTPGQAPGQPQGKGPKHSWPEPSGQPVPAAKPAALSDSRSRLPRSPRPSLRASEPHAPPQRASSPWPGSSKGLSLLPPISMQASPGLPPLPSSLPGITLCPHAGATTVGLGAPETLPGLRARRPTDRVTCSGPWEPGKRRAEAEVGRLGARPPQQEGASPGPPLGAGSSGPLFWKSPQGSRAALPAQRERTGGPPGEEGSAENYPRVWCYPILPRPAPEGADSRRQSPGILSEKTGPPAGPSPQRSTKLSDGAQTPTPAPAPEDSGGLRRKGWLGAPRPLLLPALPSRS